MAEALHLEIRLDQSRPSGKVLLVNTGVRPVRLWRTGNQWGDTCLSFEARQGSRIGVILRRPQDYTRNVPSSVALEAGAVHEWPFDLRDGGWEAEVPIEALTVPGTELTAIYDVPASAEAAEQGVWTGQLRSQPVRLQPLILRDR